jgi:hypothetical protein
MAQFVNFSRGSDTTALLVLNLGARNRDDSCDRIWDSLRDASYQPDVSPVNRTSTP